MISQARGFCGTRRAAIDWRPRSRPWTASSAVSKCPQRRTRAPRTWGEPPQQALDVVISHRGLDVQVAAAFVDRSHIDHELPGASAGYGGAPGARRSRSPGRNCRTRRSCSQPGPPRSPGMVRRSRREPHSGAGSSCVDWRGQPTCVDEPPDSTRSPFQDSMNACIGAKSRELSLSLRSRPAIAS